MEGRPLGRSTWKDNNKIDITEINWMKIWMTQDSATGCCEYSDVKVRNSLTSSRETASWNELATTRGGSKQIEVCPSRRN
jgi:hypothetical protein